MKIAVISSGLHEQQIKIIQKKEKIFVIKLRRKNFIYRISSLLHVICISFFAQKLYIPRSSSIEYMILNQLYNHKISAMSDGLLDLIDSIPHRFRNFFSIKVENLKVNSIFTDYEKWIEQLDINYHPQSNVIVYFPKKYGAMMSEEDLKKMLPCDYKKSEVVISTRENQYSGTAVGIISHPSTIILQAKLKKDLKIFFIPSLTDIDKFQNERMILYTKALSDDKQIIVI